MVSDSTTFFLSFATVFGALGWALFRLEQHIRRLEERLQDATPPAPSKEEAQ